MSDNPGDRPENQVPASAPQDTPIDSAAASSAAPQNPTPVPPPTGWQAPRPPYPGPVPQGAYGVPPRQAAAGQQASGAAFGPAPQTQPTLPLSSDTGAAQVTTPRRSGAGKVVGLIVAAALVGGAAGLGGAYAGLTLWGGSDAEPVAGPQTITVNNPDDVTETTAIAAKVVPSVVTISASSGSGGGTGSGVIISDDGYVITNTHVVTLDGQSGDADIRATTSDGRVFDAEIVGTDPIYDLAVIKLTDASGLTPIEIADSDELNVGDATVAVGAPLGLSNTVTTGIISALNRSISVASAAAPDETEQDQAPPQEQGESPFFFDFGQGQPSRGSGETISISVIQTDAAINPGNSGGALVDDEGHLIGINVAIASAGGSSGGQAGNIGVGFAIPSAIAERVANEIIENGSATHGLLGASVQPASAVADAEIAGAYIAEVVSGGAADKAGLAEGDIVTEFDGKPITDSIDLTAQVRALAAGSRAELTFVRDGQSRTVEVTLGELGA